jgi:SAM-dependent methyltransferase
MGLYSESIRVSAATQVNGDHMSLLKKAKRKLKPIVKSLGLWQITRTKLAKKYLFGSGVEIGALHQPLRIPSGVRIRHVDHRSWEQNVESFPELDSREMVHVDFVTDGFTLEGVPSDEFDFLIANHVLEHTPDPIGALIQWRRVLKSSGILFCALPKVNASFDKGRQVTTYDHMAEDYRLYQSRNFDSIKERNKDHYLEWLSVCEPAIFKRPPVSAEEMIERVDKMLGNGDEIHFHTFTAASVRDMFIQVGKAVLPGLRILEIVETRKEVIAIIEIRNSTS